MINNGKTVKTTIRLPSSMNDEITKLAKQDLRSVNSMFLKIFDNYIKKRKEVQI